MGVSFERKPQFCTNVTYATKIKTLLLRRISRHEAPKKR